MLSMGQILDGKYRVVDVLGRGGMSIVYLCENTRLENLWAIKEVPGDLKYQVDFLTEPNILKKLSHPGIPRIIDIFYENDNLYIVEDYIKGRTLDDIVLKEGPLKLEKVCNIGISICEILEYLHSFNPPIIYRDLKPSNIMINEDGRVVLIDFGISRVYKKNQIQDTVFMGSKGYAAPEQFGNSQSGKQTDIYGLGATLYYMIFGRAPFNISEPLKDESYNEYIDVELRKIIKKSMQIDMEKRFTNVFMLKNALKNVLIKNSSTIMLNNDGINYYDEPTEAYGVSIEEGNFEKTRFLNISEEPPNTILMDRDREVFEKTVLMDNKKEKPVMQRKVLKRTLLAVALIVVYLISARLLAAISNTSSAKQVDNKKTDEVKIADSKIKINNLNRDEVVEGVIYKKSPLISKILSDNKIDEKGKTKGKDKKSSREDEDSKINYLLYEVNPKAEVRKYNKNIIFRLEKLEVVNDILVTYLTIENYSDKTISITYENNTTVMGSDGKVLSPYSSLSTDISKIAGGQTKRDVKIVFKGFSLNTDFIKLSTKIKIEDPLYSNRDVNLKVNIK